MLSTFTYGPAKAAPARRNGDAATAAIVDLIDMFLFKYLARKNPADDRPLDMGSLVTSTQGYDLSSPLYEVIYTTVTLRSVPVTMFITIP